MVQPLFEFCNYGIQLPNHWSTISNGAEFGVDYFTRTAVAKSNIFVNRPNETKYFYQDLDSAGQRLNGVTFAKDQMPPVRGFWSLTLYNEHHFFARNDLNRYSVGTKTKSLKNNDDGSLTIYVQNDPPSGAMRGQLAAIPQRRGLLALNSFILAEGGNHGRNLVPSGSAEGQLRVNVCGWQIVLEKSVSGRPTFQSEQ